jgi:hypothetical protein
MPADEAERRQMRLVVRWVACGGCALIALAFFGIVIAVGVGIGMPLIDFGG